jgi:hypothetical protein
VKPADIVSDREHGVAGVERRMRHDAELTRERVHCVLVRSEPRTSDVNAVAGAVDGPNPPTDAVARFEHADLSTGASHMPRRSQSCIPSTNDTYVAVDSIGHCDIVARDLSFRPWPPRVPA